MTTFSALKYHADRPSLTPLATAIALCLGIVTTCPVHAALNIPSTPIQTNSGVAANLMFILDDSGSMHWEGMPDFLYIANTPSLHLRTFTVAPTTLMVANV